MFQSMTRVEASESLALAPRSPPAANSTNLLMINRVGLRNTHLPPNWPYVCPVLRAGRRGNCQTSGSVAAKRME